MLKSVIFDCDGVMFDSRETNRRYYNDLLTAFGYPKMSEEEVDYVHMHNVTDSVHRIFKHHPPHRMDEVHRYRLNLDYSPYLSYMVMEPDLLDFLEFAKSRYRLAISTNRTTTMQPLLRTFKLAHYFERVVTALDVPRAKPAPDALFDILAYFGCAAEEAIYIGDSVIDRQHSEAAGVSLIAFRNPDLPAEYHVDSFTQIRQLAPFAG
jgi:HAD superfamily hydrolase (TIGR01549 family)